MTFVAGTSGLDGAGLVYDGRVVAVAAVMEAPVILSALWLVARSGAGRPVDGDLWREILLNGSIVLLIGSFAIDWITGTEGLTWIASFIASPFQGVTFPFNLTLGLAIYLSVAGGMVSVVCIVRAERLDTLLDAAFAVVEPHCGVVTVTDCEVLRAERS
ncbi:Na+-dependent bicarbonate transporter superfamily protein [Jannaschia faecimaris]|uniref:Na+-dependent bicarbonate transporter superfamily protein n=1 Tax=Jannaschia faecimaris TaxID=1244108 RepID=A0A1H3INU3_9RHOB|nr:Na+-dependent bicarbonate transporter superfamily protein [Jannaschia faecimaris]